MHYIILNFKHFPTQKSGENTSCPCKTLHPHIICLWRSNQGLTEGEETCLQGHGHMMLYESTAENSFKWRRHSILETLTKLYFEFIYLQFRIKVKLRKDHLYCLFEEKENSLKKYYMKGQQFKLKKLVVLPLGKRIGQETRLYLHYL